jgi:hypothetical protein
MSMQSRSVLLVLLAASVAAGPALLAQDPKPQPLVGDPAKSAGLTPVKPAGPMPPLVFHKPLPTTPVATIDGAPVTQGDLMKFLVKGNWQTVIQTLILVNLLELELQKVNLTVSEEEIKDEQMKILEKVAPGKSAEDVAKLGVFSPDELRRQAWLSRGWDKLFLSENKLQPENSANNANAILKQLFIRQRMEKYEIRQRGMEPAPAEGFILELKPREGSEVRKATADDALGFLLGLVKPGSLQDAVQEVIDAALVDRELAKAGKTVKDDEIEAWANAMTAKYPPPFDWRMICQFKGTTPDAERERWRRLEAWKRVTGWKLDEAALKGFIKEHEDHFSGEHKNVSHILLMTSDPVTGLAGSAERDAEAKKKIGAIHEKVVEGLDFAWLAERYSEDIATAKAKGALTQPIKKFGGGLDPEFQKAAWALKLDEISPPVKSKFGWHVIKCDKVTPGQRGGADFEVPTYREWIVDEYETLKMKEWVAGVRKGSKIEVVPDAELFEIKTLGLKPK